MNDDPTSLCHLLDAYLDGELTADERAALSAHVQQCADCKDALDKQRWIDSLLTSDVAAEIESLPRIMPLRRPRQRWIAAAAAAAAVVLLAAWLGASHLLDGQDEGQPAVAVASRPAPSIREGLPGARTAAQTPPKAWPAASFVSSSDAIAIPVASPDPQVTIVKLYPTLTASRRIARPSTFPRQTVPPNGG